MRIPFVLLVCLLMSGSAFAEGLAPGSQPPALDGIEWVVGETVDPAKPGTLKLVVFWTAQDQNTGPVFNLLGEIQKQHPDVTIAALTTDPLDQTRQILLQVPVPFSVGVDATGTIVEGYLDGAPGIPYSVVIGADGKVVWAGHPLGMMQRVVKALKAGTYDPAQMEKAEALQQELQQAMQGVQSGQTRPDQIITILDKLIANDPTNSQWYNLKIQVFSQTGAGDQVPSVLKTWFDNVQEDAQSLSALGTMIMGMDRPDQIDPALAVAAVSKAWSLDGGKTPKVGLGVARVYEKVGLFAKAIEISTAAKEASDEAEVKRQFDTYIQYLGRLVEAQKAAQ